MIRFLLAVSLFSLVSCSFNKPAPKEDLVLSSDAAIMGGTQVAQNASIASGIVSVYDVKDNAICTGSIIAENFILTAAHCSTAKRQNLKIVFGLDVDDSMNAREPDIRELYVRNVVGIQVHPDYNPEENEDKETDWNDIAIIKFQGPLPPGYKPVQMLPDNSLLKRGAIVTLAGYGISQVDLEPVDPRKVRNFEEALAYGEVLCDEKQRNCLRVDMSGDGVLRETTAPISVVHDTEVRLDESKGRGTCSGDSGGPAYIEQGGHYLLFGITSRGSVVCDSVGVYTNAVMFKNWIAETLLKMK